MSAAREMTFLGQDMVRAAGEADGQGLAMDEYDEYGFPEEFCQRMQFAMDRWENGVADLMQAAKEVVDIATEMRGAESEEEPRRPRSVTTVELPE